MELPALIQARMSPSITSNALVSVWKERFNRPTGSGNLYLIAVQWGSSTATVTSVVDDKGNNWSSITAVVDAGNGQSAQYWYLKNGTAGTKQVTITLSTGLAFVSVLGPWEWNCIDTGATPTDGSAGRATSGAAISSGSFSSTVQDLIVQAVFVDSTPTQTTRMTWTPAAGYKLLTPDGSSFTCAQWSVQNPGAQNPALTSSVTTTGAISCTAAFKVLSGAGTPRPPGIGVNRVIYQMFPGMINGVIVDSTSWTYQFPCEGSLLVLGIQTKNNNTVTSITDSNGNTWKPCGTPAKDTLNDHVVEHWFAANAKPSETMTVTITWGTATGSTPSSSPTVYLMDVPGGGTCTASVNSNGTSAATSGTIVGGTITPPAGGIVIAFQQEDGETITSLNSPASGFILSPDIGQYATDGAEKDGGLGVYYAPDSNPVTVSFGYSNYETGTPINKWVQQLVAFDALQTPVMGSVNTASRGVGPVVKRFNFRTPNQLGRDPFYAPPPQGPFGAEQYQTAVRPGNKFVGPPVLRRRFQVPAQVIVTAAGTTLTLAPPEGLIVVGGNAPALLSALGPTEGGIVVGGNAPSLLSLLAPTAGSIVVGGNTPSLLFVLGSSTGSIVVGGNAPTLLTAVSPTEGSIVIGGNAPGLAVGFILNPPEGSIVIGGNSPTLLSVLSPTDGSVIVGGNVPSIARLLSPTEGAVIVSGNTPSMALLLGPAEGAILISGNAPTLLEFLVPGSGAIVIGGQVPDVVVFGGDQFLAPAEGLIIVDGNSPGLLIITPFVEQVGGSGGGGGGGGDPGRGGARRNRPFKAVGKRRFIINGQVEGHTTLVKVVKTEVTKEDLAELTPDEQAAILAFIATL